MLSRVRCALFCLFMVVLHVPLAVADEGMWLVNKPPVKELKEKYGFEPTAAWLEHVQKSSVRFNMGGSGSIVSADGLVMTNHHVGYDTLEKLSTSSRNLLESGFYAKTRAEEIKCDDAELMVLWSIADVTDRIKGATTKDMTPADANTARRKAMTTLEQETEKDSGLHCQVVTLYQGGVYHLYSYKRYTDVRLVMAPEQKIANFGGDTDNFEFPRFDLDMCFFRIYENGEPLRPQHYLSWSAEGVSNGDLVFVSGHPGRTQRMFTVDHLKFLRDVELPSRLRSLWRAEVKSTTFANRSDENARISSAGLLGVQNGRKALTGMLAGLHDPHLMLSKAQKESTLRAAVAANPDYNGQWGDAWDMIAQAQKNYREFHARHRTRVSSELFSIALSLVRLAEERTKPNSERLREFRDSELDSLYLDLFSPAPIYEEYEAHRLSASLSDMAEVLGGDDPMVVTALGSQSPRKRAETLVFRTKLKDVAVRKALADGGKEAIEQSVDPMIKLAIMLDPELRAIRKRHEDEVEALERRGYDKIAAAEFAISGDNRYPDATFTLRLSYGQVKGYEENNKTIAPITTIGGTFERAEQRKGDPLFVLPPRWIERKEKLNPSTPFNFVSTADIIGGNSGSPTINREGEVVGLIFDGNIHSLVLDFQYEDGMARAVSVDSRAIIETLRNIYDAGALVDEMLRK